jgi:hypothetical protein
VQIAQFYQGAESAGQDTKREYENDPEIATAAEPSARSPLCPPGNRLADKGAVAAVRLPLLSLREAKRQIADTIGFPITTQSKIRAVKSLLIGVV